MAATSPATGRRRRGLVLVAVGLVAFGMGAVLGLLGGRATAPTVADQMATSRSRGYDVIEHLQRLPSEYEQTRSGLGGRTDATFAATLDVVRHHLDEAIDATPWFGARTIAEVQVSVDRLRADARSHVDAVKFSTDTDRAVDVIAKAFGVTVTPLDTP